MWVNIKQGDQSKPVHWGTGHCAILRCGNGVEEQGTQDDRKVLFVSLLSGCCSWVAIYGWCLFWLLLNIQAIFSILGCIPCIWETTVLDCHWPLLFIWKTLTKSLLLSVSEKVVWAGSMSVSWSSRTMA